MSYTIVIGTNRPGSNSKKIGDLYKEKLSKLGVEVCTIDMMHLPKDFVFSNMFKSTNSEFEPFQKIVDQTKKFVFIIPEYNGSFPGILKAFIDACRYPDSFIGKKCCLVGLSAGQFGNIRGLEHFTGVAHYAKMEVCQSKLYLPAVFKEFDEKGEINNPKTLERIDHQIEVFIKF